MCDEFKGSQRCMRFCPPPPSTSSPSAAASPASCLILLGWTLLFCSYQISVHHTNVPSNTQHCSPALPALQQSSIYVLFADLFDRLGGTRRKNSPKLGASMRQSSDTCAQLSLDGCWALVYSLYFSSAVVHIHCEIARSIQENN